MKKKAKAAPKGKPRKKISAPDEAALRRIPKQVEVFLKDLQQQMQSGAIDLTDWRSLGVGILNRIGQVSATLRTATGTGPKAPAKTTLKSAKPVKPLKRAKSVTTRAAGMKKVVKKSVAKSAVKKAKKH